MPGVFIALEGGEGAGKSVQAEAVRDRLTSVGHSVIVTREPGGTPLGERLRELLLDLSNAHTQLEPISEALLFLAARAQLVSRVIRPALARGDVVICDRFADSTRAYQGYGRGIDLGTINQLNAIATDGLEPDLVILLDLAPSQGLSRASAADDRFGRERLAFHERVRAGYLALAAEHRGRWLVVDATQPVDAVTEMISRRMDALL